MDNNPQDHFQMPCPMIKLQSSDGEIFEVEVKVAKLSSYIKNMLDDLGVEENEVIPIPQNAPEISGAILEKIIKWGNHHKDDPSTPEDDDKQVKRTDDTSSWDIEFLQVDQLILFQLTRAADYLNINGLLDVACMKVAMIIKGMTPEEVRRTFHIQNDFSPDEEEQVRKENAWFADICVGENDHVYRRVESEIPASCVEDENNDSSQATKDCLNNSNVVRKMFTHLSDSVLLKLSFVNKMWNYEARSVMKKRGNLSAFIRFTDEKPCQEHLQDFLATMQQMNVVPFSGINIHIRHSYRYPCPTEVPGRFHYIILEKLKLKKVYVAANLEDGNCPGLLLAKKVLLDFSEVLEDLSLQMDAKEKTFLSDVVQDCKFPRLKVLKLEEFHRNGGQCSADTNTMKKLVSHAPTLQELRTARPMGSALNALEGSPAKFVYTRCVFAPYDDVIEAAIGALRVEKLSLDYTSPLFDFDRFSQITPGLLHDSCTTLRLMEIHAVLAVPLMCYGVALENLMELDMIMNYSELEWRQPRILGIVKDLNFIRIFPNLNKVRVYAGPYTGFRPEHMDRIVERANAVLTPTNPLPDRAANIKELEIDDSNLSNASAQFFAQMFPNIKRLAVRRREKTREIPFGFIWKHWEDLVELEVSGRLGQNSDNFDSVFCGIFPEEVAELRQEDDEYLKKVNIVPVMPAITCLKNLKILNLKYNGHEAFGDDIFVDDGTFMFSKVTALIAFASCPALAASLTFTSSRAPPDFNYLEPYVSVKSAKVLKATRSFNFNPWSFGC